MTPQEKAQELVDRFYDLQDSDDLGNEQLNKDMEALYEERGAEMEPYWQLLSKNSALLAVDELIRITNYKCTLSTYREDETTDYWESVKKELKKL